VLRSFSPTTKVILPRPADRNMPRDGGDNMIFSESIEIACVASSRALEMYSFDPIARIATKNFARRAESGPSKEGLTPFVV